MKTYVKDILDFLLLYFSVDIPFTIAYAVTALLFLQADISFAYVAGQSAVVSLLIVLLWKLKHWYKIHHKTER